MNIEDLNIFSEVDEIIVGNVDRTCFKGLQPLPVESQKSLVKLLSTQDQNVYKTVLSVLAKAKLRQMQSCISLMLNAAPDALKEFVDYVDSESKRGMVLANLFVCKINYIVMHCILANTLIDVNMVELNKTIKQHD